MAANSFAQFVNKLQRQFLCAFPVACISWHDISADITWQQQEELIRATYGHKLNQEQPVKIAYQLNFLKRLLQQLETTAAEVHDIVYESYCEVQQRIAEDTTQKFAYKHYLVPAHNAAFSLRESKSFVTEGTTGLCSWQASLALADYFLAHRELTCNRSVMELGAGTGLCGYILSGCCGVRNMLLTDGTAECVDLMRQTIASNFPQAKEVVAGTFKYSEQQLQVKQMSWNEIECFRDDVLATAPDLLIAADVVYDDRLFEELAHAIDFIFSVDATKRLEMYLAATVRNEHTLQTFLHLLEQLNYHTAERANVSEEQSALYWDRRTPVRILHITKIR